MVLLWIFLAVGALAIEAALSTAFFAFFLAIGFAAGAVAAAAGAPPWLQTMLVAALAVLGVVLFRPFLVSRVGGRAPVVSGAADMVGQRAITVDEVGDEHHPGHAMLAGERWLAVSETNLPLPPQTSVMVTSVRGTTLVVRIAAAAVVGRP